MSHDTMSVDCFEACPTVSGNQQASQLGRIAEKHKIELDNLQREKKAALEAQLGNGKAGNTLSSANEVRLGAENSAGAFYFCPLRSSYVFPLSLFEIISVRTLVVLRIFLPSRVICTNSSYT
jgi:hypothetical protein